LGFWFVFWIDRLIEQLHFLFGDREFWLSFIVYLLHRVSPRQLRVEEAVRQLGVLVETSTNEFNSFKISWIENVLNLLLFILIRFGLREDDFENRLQLRLDKNVGKIHLWHLVFVFIFALDLFLHVGLVLLSLLIHFFSLDLSQHAVQSLVYFGRHGVSGDVQGHLVSYWSSFLLLTRRSVAFCMMRSVDDTDFLRHLRKLHYRLNVLVVDRVLWIWTIWTKFLFGTLLAHVFLARLLKNGYPLISHDE
jgi:hypothetical protein